MVEIMVVIVILGLLATVVGQSVLGARDDAEERVARVNVNGISEAVTLFMMRQTGRRELPTLEMLITPDERGYRYLEGFAENPKDPWGNEYEIRPGDRPGLFEVICYGPDGLSDTDDDINSTTLKDG